MATSRLLKRTRGRPQCDREPDLVRVGIKPWSSVEEGAEAILHLATSPALVGRSGLYFNGLREARADRQAYDAKARQRLKAISLELTSLSSAVSAG